MPARAPQSTGKRYRVKGLVQGVGFRPFVWRLAQEEGIDGFVLNDGEGVLIEAYAAAAALTRLERRLFDERPPLSRVDSLDADEISGPVAPGFVIRDSHTGTVSTGIIADAATCSACLNEISDSTARRFRYPFTNCTHCGPRLTIVRGIPYDRANTTMAPFAMCEDCAREYADPADRRFHAEAIACPACGPTLWLEDVGGRIDEDPLSHAAKRILAGEIVAIKGLGGFHLACDALSETAVNRLRARKQREAKPLAVMVRDLPMARRIAHISEAEEHRLVSAAAPIVLLHSRSDGLALAKSVCTGLSHVGVMLPSTPLHHLLMQAVDRPLVMTSGNRSSEPQCIANNEAREKLFGIADIILLHDREIASRLDDSVIRIDARGPTILRRARGYSPEPIPLAGDFAQASTVLALGGELKSTFCFLRANMATLSPYIGDLTEGKTRDDYHARLSLFRKLYDISPETIVVDQHPDYASTTMGEAIARESGASLLRVQHHHAHLAACLAENGISIAQATAVPTLGIILDGTGLGEDGTLWGGEFLLGGYGAYERVGHLASVALPGGERAAREPWRNTVAQLRHTFGPEWRQAISGTDLAAAMNGKPVAALEEMVARGVNAPMTSSAGRLFDAVAGAVGLCFNAQDYEGHAAMALEACATDSISTESAYAFGLERSRDLVVVDPGPMWRGLLADLGQQKSRSAISARFHLGLIEVLASAAALVRKTHVFERVALSGGAFANRLVLDRLSARLGELGFRVLVHKSVPSNDGGLSFGQACVAASICARTASSTTS